MYYILKQKGRVMHEISNNAQARILQHYSMFSKKERAAADFVLQNTESVSQMSVGEWASAAGISKASVVRFCQSLGFKGADEFKAYLEMGAAFAADEVLQSVKTDTPAEQTARDVCAKNINSIYESLLVLDVNKVALLARELLSKNKILILGTGASGTIAGTLQNGLLQLGISARYINDAASQVLAGACAEQDTLIIVINHSGKEKNIEDALKLAKEQGATIAAIIGIVGSPIDELADYSLYCGLPSEHYISDQMSSRISELNVVSVLLALISQEVGSQLDAWNERKRRAFETRRLPVE